MDSERQKQKSKTPVDSYMDCATVALLPVIPVTMN